MIPKKSVFALAKALEGLPVLGALQGSPAERAGIRYGDVLISVNGTRTRTASDYIEAKGLRDGAMEVVIFRAGLESMLELRYDERGAVEDPASILAELVTLRIAPTENDGSGPGSSGAA